MPQFYPLKVASIRKDTRNAVVVTLEPEAADREAFNFIQGQYLTFRREFEEEELRRSYSICAGINDGYLRVGIKKVDGGWFSTWANEELKVGDTLEAMPPNGNFFADLEPEKKKSYIGFAGGSGITPVISIIKTVMETEPDADFTLVYANRSINSIMFREELEDLKNDYMGRLSVLHILENDPGEIELFNGRMDREKCDKLFSGWLDVKNADTAFICGPEPMMLVISDALKAHGMDAKNIKFELFKSSHPKKARAKEANGAADGATIEATIILDGAARTIQMPKGVSVLEAAQDAELDPPFSCQAGVCSTCKAKVVEGEAEMEANYGLEDYEVEAGFVLTCQCYPQSDKVVIDYDQH